MGLLLPTRRPSPADPAARSQIAYPYSATRSLAIYILSGFLHRLLDPRHVDYGLSLLTGHGAISIHGKCVLSLGHLSRLRLLISVGVLMSSSPRLNIHTWLLVLLVLIWDIFLLRIFISFILAQEPNVFEWWRHIVITVYSIVETGRLGLPRVVGVSWLSSVCVTVNIFRFH